MKNFQHLRQQILATDLASKGGLNTSKISELYLQIPGAIRGIIEGTLNQFR